MHSNKKAPKEEPQKTGSFITETVRLNVVFLMVNFGTLPLPAIAENTTGLSK
jgi:hypothetical protein